MLHRTVGDLMTRDVATVRPETSFKEIAALLASRGVSAVAVVDDRGAPVGVVSEADLLRKEAAQTDNSGHSAGPHTWGKDRAKARAEIAAELMTTPVASARADWSVPEAARAMERLRVKRLLVLDDADRLIGIVSRVDLLSVFLRTDKAIGEEIAEEVLKRTLWLDERDVQVQVDDGVVTLHGKVEHRTVAQIAERLTKAVDGVVAVRSLIEYSLDDTTVRPEPRPWVRGVIPSPHHRPL
jgi:CBS domain-containing protein